MRAKLIAAQNESANTTAAFALLAAIQVNQQANDSSSSTVPASASSHLTIAKELATSQAALQKLVADLSSHAASNATAPGSTSAADPSANVVSLRVDTTITIGKGGASLALVQAAYAEPSQAEPSHAEPSYAETGQTEQSKAA